MRSSTKVTRRGRPREFEPDKVLAAACRVFMAKGFAATSLDDLAAATGVNRPSLYAAFGDKEQLYVHALRRYGAKAQAAMQAILSGSGSIESRLTRLYGAAIDQYCAPPHRPGCMIICTAATEAPSRPAIAATAVELLATFEASFERAFAQAVAGGELASQPSPAARARLAGSMFDTLAVRARLGARASDLKAFAASGIAAICGGARAAAKGGRHRRS
jgi:AcrR family transcriptional regulator